MCHIASMLAPGMLPCCSPYRLAQAADLSRPDQSISPSAIKLDTLQILCFDESHCVCPLHCTLEFVSHLERACHCSTSSAQLWCFFDVTFEHNYTPLIHHHLLSDPDPTDDWRLKGSWSRPPHSTSVKLFGDGVIGSADFPIAPAAVCTKCATFLLNYNRLHWSNNPCSFEYIHNLSPIFAT